MYLFLAILQLPRTLAPSLRHHVCAKGRCLCRHLANQQQLIMIAANENTLISRF